MHLDMKNLKKKKKKKKKKKEEEKRNVEKLIESHKGSLNKFVISNKHINDNLGEKLINEQEIHQKELEDNVVIQQKDDIEWISHIIN
jgi:hypothetical protein